MTRPGRDDAPPTEPARDGGPVDDVLAYYATQGFKVAYRTDDEVGLLRTNSWGAVILSTVVGGIGGVLNPSPRRQRIWLHIDEDGVAVVRHYSRSHT